MKKILFILTLFMLLPCLCCAQSIFIDYYIQGELDQSLFWVLTDPNGVKWKGNCDIALGLDPNAYVQDHMAGWLIAIYAANADPNVPDWTNSHMGKYQAGLNLLTEIDQLISAASTMADVKLILTKQNSFKRKMFKAVYPVVGMPD